MDCGRTVRAKCARNSPRGGKSTTKGPRPVGAISLTQRESKFTTDSDFQRRHAVDLESRTRFSTDKGRRSSKTSQERTGEDPACHSVASYAKDRRRHYRRSRPRRSTLFLFPTQMAWFGLGGVPRNLRRKASAKGTGDQSLQASFGGHGPFKN